MDSHGVRLPLSERESFLSIKKKEIVGRSIALIQTSLDRCLDIDLDKDFDINLAGSVDRSLGDATKGPRTRKRSRDNDEEEEPTDDDEKRVRIIEFGKVGKLKSLRPFKKGAFDTYKAIDDPCPTWNAVKGLKEHIFRYNWRIPKPPTAAAPKPENNELMGNRLAGIPCKANIPDADTQGKVKQRYIPSLHGLRHREVPGTVNDVPVKAVPDYGSSIDAISDGFARKHGMEVKAADKILIKLPGGGIAESVGVVIGHFKFQSESQTYTRYFRVLKKCAFDMVLGREFLKQTKTLTDFCHRIVKRFRPCVQKGGRFFLLDESPKDRIRCAVNGSDASAFPDTGSDLMLVSGNFARRNNLKVHRGKKYRQEVQLADGSFIRTDGMTLDAELEFDTPPMSSPREFDLGQYLEYDRGLTDLLKEGRGVKAANDKSVFICDLHVVDDLPCDIILSSDFIFDHQVFSRFKHLFFTEPPPPDHPDPHPSRCIPDPGGDKPSLGDYLLYIRSTKKARQWFRWGWRRPPTPPPPLPSDPNDNNAVPLQQRPTWEELWEAEEARRNRMQLRIASLSEPLRAEEQRVEAQRREDWDRNHPRLPHPLRLVLPLAGEGIGFGMGMAASRVGVVGQPPGGVGSV